MSIPNLELFPNRVLKGLIGSPILDHDFSHLCFGRRFQISGHFDFGIFNDVVASSVLAWVLADIASAACLAHPGSLEIMSMTFVAVICDAVDLNSANTAYDPEYHLSHCHFWYF